MTEANLTIQSGELDKDFDPDERLFHYTSSRGLYGILESGCLWATHFKFLNDSNEFFAARKSLTDFVEQKIKAKIAALKVSGIITFKDGVSLKDLSRHEAEVIVDANYAATLRGIDPFVFSSYVSKEASENFRNGELLHWATYGRDGGYALEINPHKLAALLMPKENILSQKAVYVGADVPKNLIQDYAIIGELARNMIVAILDDKLEGVDFDQGAKAFMRVASIIKDRFFENEKEARLVAMRLKRPYEGYAPPDVFIRHHQSGPVPYIKLFENRLLGPLTPIESIIIGPHPERERRKETLSIFLEARGLKDIAIFQSNVPYLGT